MKTDTDGFDSVLLGRRQTFDCDDDSSKSPGVRLKVGQAFKLFEMDATDRPTGRRITTPIVQILTGSIFGIADGQMRVVLGQPVLEIIEE